METLRDGSHDRRLLHGESVRDDCVRLLTTPWPALQSGRGWPGEEWRQCRLQASAVERRDATHVLLAV